MTSVQTAIEQDIAQNIIEASNEYELTLKQADTKLAIYINLACLYWQSTDYGFHTEKGLPLTFVQKAGDRMYEVLELAKQKFGNMPEIEFWRLYFNFVTLGDEPFPKLALNLAERQKEFLVPYFHIYDQTKNAAYLPKVKELLNQARQQLTTKNRYIVSILEANNI